MKNEKALQNAIDYLNNCVTMSGEINKCQVSLALEYLREFLVDNTPKPKGTYNLWDFVAKDGMRPVMQGIYYDLNGKVAVASDGHILGVSKDLYNEEFADTIRAKNGEIIPGRHPNWKSVIRDRTYMEKVQISIDTIREGMKNIIASTRAKGEKASRKEIFVRLPHAAFSCEILLRLLGFVGTDTLLYSTNATEVYAEKGNRLALGLGLWSNSEKWEWDETCEVGGFKFGTNFC